MNETTTTRNLFAAGKSVITADGTRATSIEFLGRKQVIETQNRLTAEGDALFDRDPVDFADLVADHFEWCDDCDSSKDAYHHEMEVRDAVYLETIGTEPTC